MPPNLRKCAAAACGLAIASAAAAYPASLIHPNSATAGSTFSASYDIANAIDGSGLPAGFDLSSEHGTYVVNNHWTTQAGAIGAGTAWAEFFFDSPQILGQFHLWNHRSNGVASNAYYAVTQFDLELRDADGNALLRLDNVAAGGLAAGSYSGGVETFQFAATQAVRSVWFHIDRNVYTDMFGGGGVYTGVAEVAFGAPVPEPAAWSLLLAGGAVLMGRSWRRAARRVATDALPDTPHIRGHRSEVRP